VSVDRIVEELWPGTPPDTATHAVQVYVSQLRKALGDVVARQTPGYVLHVDPTAIDVHRFASLARDGHDALREEQAAVATDALRSALALWRGPALVDFAYEPFAQAEIARLDELRFGALEDRIDADLSLGRHAELVPEIEALVESQPLRERPRGLLMRALYLAGRQAEALAAYRGARTALVEELGIEPGPELRELEAAILRQDESLLPARTVAPSMRTRRLAAVLSVALVEEAERDVEAEDQEVEQLAATVAAAAARHGGVAERVADGSVVAVFGVPVAHEDDPLRAARAAEEARSALAASDSLAFGAAIDVGEVVAAERSVSGAPVRSAARLRAEARAGEILLSPAATRRIAHAARLETRGEGSALVAMAPTAPAFAQRLDTPLVGRTAELAALRGALSRARRSSTTGGVLVAGAPGVGKSRLARELVRRSRGVTTLTGRCLSYGDGITYWPIRQMLAQAPAGAARDAALAALDAETPPPATEIALLFRRLCEALARTKPLVVVFDDLHWAEPTLLDLVGHLLARGDGPILVVLPTREELVQERPGFFDSYGNVELLALDTLSDEATETLLDGLDGAVLAPEQRARLVDAAEGNPFFLEQLVALALEGGLVERPLPETVQSLLSARLDRLGPGERAVLERGAVVGKEFTTDDVVALLEPTAAPTAEPHLATLADRGFVLARGDGALAFRHALLQEAVYRSTPKRLRAELHERFADRLDDAYSELPELDEFVGYHLEQAHRLRRELGDASRLSDRLAEDAGRRLGEAGVRASKRADVPASVGLLRRATSLVPAGHPLRAELLVELGINLEAAGEPEGAMEAQRRAIEDAHLSNRPGVEASARVELEYVRLPLTAGATADSLLEAAEAAIPVLEAAGDHRRLGRALLLAGWVHGGRRGDNAAREEAAERALEHYERSSWTPSICAGEVANALYYGPRPVPEAVERCEELLRMEALTRYGRASVEVFLGGLIAQRGELDRARELIENARATYGELGHPMSAATYSGVVRADVELLADDPRVAEETLRWVCSVLEQARAFSRLASRAGDLAEALYRQGRPDEAADWVSVGERHTAADDVDALVLWMPVKAKLAAIAGDGAAALELAGRARDRVDATDGLNRRAAVWSSLGEVHRLTGDGTAAASAFARATELYAEKGNLVGAARVRSLTERPEPT
jgi:DNA-binding SARP family transcriptional activator/tetratricopeptide (TPR) repeat protein